MADYYVDINGNITTKKKKQPNYIVDKDGNISAVGNIAPVKDENTWLKKGALENGSSATNVSKTILGSAADLTENLLTGVVGVGEKVVDAAAYAAGGVGKLFGADQFASDMEAFIAKDLYDERNIAKTIVSGLNAAGFASSSNLGLPASWSEKDNEWRKKTQEEAMDYVTNKAEADSVFGEKADSLVQSIGQQLATRAVGAVGVPWELTMALTSFGAEAENALNSGATFGQAGASAAISAAAEIISEKLFSGGIINAKGWFGNDKGAVDALGKGLAVNLWNTLKGYAKDIGEEAFEEVFSEVVSRFGTAIYKVKTPEELGELMLGKDAWTDYFDAAIGGGIMGGLAGGKNAVVSAATGRDYSTGMTQNEQKVVKAEYEARLAEAEKNGKVSKVEKEKLYDRVIKDMKKGRISTDTIEKVLGGKDYGAYETSVKDEENLKNRQRELLAENDAIMHTDMTDADKQKMAANEQELAEIEEKLNGKPVEVARKNLSDNVFKMVEKDSALRESYYERDRVRQKYTADVSKYKGKAAEIVQKAIDSGMLNNTSRTHDMVDLVAKVAARMDTGFDWTNNKKLAESGFAIEGKVVNGYVTKDGITLNLDGNKALNAVVGHEITHVLEGTELYDKLSESVVKYARKKGDYDARLKDLTELYKNIDGADVNRELVADLVGEYLFTDSKFLDHLVQDQNLFQKVWSEVKYLYNLANADSDEARQLLEVKRAFERAWNNGKAQKNTADDGGNKYSLTKYSEQQKKNWEHSKRIVIYDNAEQLNQFIQDSIANKTMDKKMYFGSIPADLAEAIKSATGLEVENYNLSLGSYEIRKILKDHGDDASEAKRGQRAVVPDDFAHIVDVVLNPESIKPSQSTYMGKPVIEFVGENNGKMHVVAVVSDKRLDLFVQTAFVNAKKGNLTTPTGEQAPINTPEANSGTVSTNNVPQSVPPVKGDYSLSASDPDIAPIGDFNVYGDDIRLDTAPVAETKTTTPAVAAPDEVAPVANKTTSVAPVKAKNTQEQVAKAKVLAEEPSVKKRFDPIGKIKNLVLDKGMVFEDLSIKTGNRELQAKWNSIRYADAKAQNLMENGKDGVKSLKAIREEVSKTGKTKEFYEYLYHMLNADRMTLAQRYENTPNKPVFGDSVSAMDSTKIAADLERANPEFKQFAKDVYSYMNYLRDQMVDNGVISKETAKLWSEMYPHYVPIRREGDTGLNINVPLDTGRTGVNAPVKKATGGDRNILPLFDTMGQRTIQTYKAIAKNRFGVELKNTLGSSVENEAMMLDEIIDGVEHDELLRKGENGKKPTFTVFENGERVTFEITDEMYDAMKPTNEVLASTSKTLKGIGDFRRATLTEYNPWFLLKNAVKDVQDVLLNSQHAAKTYAAIPKALDQMVTKGKWFTEYMENGGEQNSYFDTRTNTFAEQNKALEIAKTVTGLNAISKANNIIERLPRLAEYIASREMGRSVDVAMLDSARVTTNFAAGGDLTKFLNRNGATFLNASVQGAMQQARNIREAKMNGLKGWASLAGKFVAAGVPALILNHLLWDDDDEYKELSNYVKQNYYIVGKYGDGQFVRIPKGRTVSVIQNAFEQMENAITGNAEVDLNTFVDLVVTNLAPNNPVENNVLSPIIQVASNETWYGEDLVPTRLQDLPAAEQYDESTDAISRWLGEKFNISPYKANYLLDQYSGVIGDTFLPMLTPEAESGNNTLAGNLIAPLKDMFTTDSVMNNQNVSDFYDKVDELTVNANGKDATDEDVLMSKYMNTIKSEMGALYGEKRKIQSGDLPDDKKYAAVRSIQQQIDSIAKKGLSSYKNVKVDGKYATVGDVQFRWYEPGEDSDAEPGWKKLTDKQIKKQNEVTKGLGITPSQYWSKKDEYDFAYEYPGKYAVSKSVGGYDSYAKYSKQLNKIVGVDLNKDGKTDTGSRKENVVKWINKLDADYGTKLILFKNEYKSDDTYNYEIVEYLNGRKDLTFSDMVSILKELDMNVSLDGTVTW